MPPAKPDTPTLLPRAAGLDLTQLLKSFPVVIVNGARQTGKSTLVLHHPALTGHRRILLDDAATRAEAAADPDGLIARGPAIVDEAQRVPDLLLAIKAQVDRTSQSQLGHFVLTGSANFLLMRAVADSLAGRVSHLTLGPMTRRELLGQGTTGRWTDLFAMAPDQWVDALATTEGPSESWTDLTERGGFPVPALRLDADARRRWFAGYVTSYLERDLRDLSAIGDLGHFQRLMRGLALRDGTIVNQTELSRDLGVPQRTISRWIDLLVTSWLIVRVPAFTVNRTSRLLKRPKIYWTDVGLARYQSAEPTATGAHLENLVLTDLFGWASLQTPPAQVMYWRTSDNAEVDFVVELGSKLLAVEIKATARPGHKDWTHLQRFSEEYRKELQGGLLLHGGTEATRVSERIVALPWWWVL